MTLLCRLKKPYEHPVLKVLFILFIHTNDIIIDLAGSQGMPVSFELYYFLLILPHIQWFVLNYVYFWSPTLNSSKAYKSCTWNRLFLYIRLYIIYSDCNIWEFTESIKLKGGENIKKWDSLVWIVWTERNCSMYWKAQNKPPFCFLLFKRKIVTFSTISSTVISIKIL